MVCGEHPLWLRSAAHRHSLRWGGGGGCVFPQGNWSQVFGPSAGPSCTDSQEGMISDLYLERSLVAAVSPEVETAVASCPLPLASTLVHPSSGITNAVMCSLTSGTDAGFGISISGVAVHSHGSCHLRHSQRRRPMICEHAVLEGLLPLWQAQAFPWTP